MQNIRYLHTDPDDLPWPSHRETDADRIARYGWPADVACTFCGDTGELPDTKMECHCLAGQALYTSRHRRSQWPQLIPRRFVTYTLAGHPNTVLAQQVGAWVDQHPVGSGENLVIQGGVGVGKTGAAIGALRELFFAGHTVRYWSLPDLMDALREEEFSRTKGDEPGRPVPTMEQLLLCDVLLLDDMGTERTTAYVADRIYLIINSRYTQGRPTILTTNLNRAQMVKHFPDEMGERIISRLYESVQEVRAVGVDLRRRGA